MRTAEQYEAMSPQELWNLSVAELETAFSYGNKTAATLLGQAYARGAKGVQQDGRKAVFYLEKSCMVQEKQEALHVIIWEYVIRKF